MIRSMIAAALSSLFVPRHFVLVRRSDSTESLAALPPEKSPKYAAAHRGKASRRHFGPSGSVTAASARMNVPPGIHRDAHGMENRTPSASSAKKGRRNGSRK